MKVLGEYFFEEINLICYTHRNFFGLVKITSGLLVHSGYRLDGPSGKLNLFVPCIFLLILKLFIYIEIRINNLHT